ncbi:DMT family transporter [Paraburkholderia sabiae]|uniref:DMT family transporter n=1 Tax=Paraburkholderia sabiae TaxID=273251 RepID=A0ABU9QL86_9BURK|nr:DMT family transporter [Paraburkholderia sabiae]WJZ77375.1 DMT family transporter [Paraburkholderia sabiae]CAD6547555.1 Pseudopaline exporter CntI [Paraburkholderia sabiae]
MLVTEKQLPHALSRQKVRGIAFMCGAIFLFAVVDVIAKLVSTRYPANEITFFRMLFGLIPAAFIFRLRNNQRRELTLHRFFGHFLRAIMALGSMGLFFAGLPHLPLSTAVTLQYTEAILIGLFAVVFLSERFRVATAVASMAGFVGVILVSSLSGNHASLLGTGLILLSAMFGAGSIIQIKKLSRTEEPAAIVLYFTVIATIVSGVSLVASWTTPDTRDLGYMALLGLTAGAGQLLLTVAFRNATASLLAPFSYFGVVWAIIFGYMIWGEVITAQAAIGSAVIVGSALYLGMSDKRMDAGDGGA